MSDWDWPEDYRDTNPRKQPDVSEIRSALAANAEGDCAQAETAYRTLVANAPTWLAALILEVEQLRAEIVRLKAER